MHGRIKILERKSINEPKREKYLKKEHKIVAMSGLPGRE